MSNLTWPKKPCMFWGLLTTHPTWTSFNRFYTTKMKWSNFSIPNLKCWRLMMILTTFKMCLVSICEPMSPNFWWPQKDMWNLKWGWPHLTKEFSIFNNCMHNWWKNCNSFFKVDSSSFDIIYPKNKPFFSTIVISTSALAWFK